MNPSESDQTRPIIQAEGLSRDFKNTHAVSDLDLAIRPGELFGLVGPDGAGKTTTLRLLAGLLSITKGSATIADKDLKTEAEAIKRVIGYMAQRFSLYSELSVLENLNFFADLHRVNRHDLPERRERLLEFAGLTEFVNRRAAHLSGGMQKKLALACTLIHQPLILLLDEPTTGVDPISRREFWDILNELHISGTTIIVSTPYMDEADRCSRVGLMYSGKMVRCAEPRQIRTEIQAEMIELIPENWEKARQIAADLDGVLEIQTYGERLHLLVDSAKERLPMLQRELRENGVEYRDLRSTMPRMEEAFISIIREMQEG